MQEAPDSGLYVAIGDKSSGPFTRQQLSAMRAEGKINPDALFWFEGLPQWTRIADHPIWRQIAGSSAPASSAPASSAGSAPASSAGSASSSASSTNKNTASDRTPTADDHERLFGGMLQESWKYHNAHFAATVVDDVFIGLLIACTLDNGWSLIDMNSDGDNHYLRFENFKDQSRVYYRVRHLTRTLTEQKTLGNRVAIIVGYGERTSDFSRLWSTLKQELKSGYLQSPEPGTITFDADMTAGYIYVQVDMFWKMEDFIGDNFSTDPKRLDRDVDACMHTLKKYLRGRTGRSA